MSGRRLLDALALVGPSRSIAAHHVAIRREQLDRYVKTSSLRKLVKNDINRYSSKHPSSSTSPQGFSRSPENKDGQGKDDIAQAMHVPSADTASSSGNRKVVLEEHQGLHQDHFYNHSQENSAFDEQSANDLEIQQRKPRRYPLPDGSIPPDGSQLGQKTPASDVLNTTPVGESAITARGKLSDTEEDAIQPVTSNAPSILHPDSDEQNSAIAAQKQQRQSEKQIPSKPAEPPGSDAFSVDAETRGDNDPEISVDQERDTFYRMSAKSSPVLSALPRVKLPKKSGNIQAGDSHLPEGTNPDTFYNSTGDGHSEATEQKIMHSLFQSPKMRRLVKDGWGRNPIDTKTQSQRGQANMSHLASSRSASSAHSSDKAASDAEKLGKDIAQEISGGQERLTSSSLERNPAGMPYQMRESRVPASRLGRLWEYGGLAASMTMGAVGEGFRRVTSTMDQNQGSFLLSAGNLERLVSKLSKMRGAALKLGQMISFQDSKMLPAPLHEVLQRVQDSADYMPAAQRDQVLTADLGSEWRNLFESFDEVPFAAASIGQVHGAVLKSNKSRVVVKVQYPGVATSIDSDLNNLAILLTASRLLPKGLYLEKTIANARTELAWECDYLREANCGRRFKSLLADDTDIFTVPTMIDSASGKQVLTMERMEGTGVTKITDLTQPEKDWIGSQVLRLCLREITEFKYMQTDPNWTNFLLNRSTGKLELLDFGASRDYPDRFISLYSQNLEAASRGDRGSVKELSKDLGYLTGYESQSMADAHVDSVLTLAEPFAESAPEVYDFRNQTITERVKALIPVMLRERLAPPPEETYSLHRKLSGAFLLCARLGSRVRCRNMFQEAMEKRGDLTSATSSS
ncbi:MAG: hypothetical protein Q9227_003000 [Pyrenula ochraceoflavens]